MTILASLLLCSLTFTESKSLALQICLDREGFSCNTIDGNWGKKSDRALAAYCAKLGRRVPASPDEAYDELFANSGELFRIETVTKDDIASLTVMPHEPTEKAKLPRMGYPNITEMFAERGHLSRRAMERMNPGVDWQHPIDGLKLVIPDFPSIERNLREWPKGNHGAPGYPKAAMIRISLSNCEISVYDAKGVQLALFPCSIAANKAKRPQQGELKVVTMIPSPNYTYTPDFVPRGGKKSCHIYQAGPRNPVGVAWIGLNLPSYGIHGTVRPESIGSPESHGCFRLSNWNIARLYSMASVGLKVVVDD